MSSQGLSRRVVLFSVEWYAGVPEIATILLVYMANIMEYTMACKGTLIYNIIDFGIAPLSPQSLYSYITLCYIICTSRGTLREF